MAAEPLLEGDREYEKPKDIGIFWNEERGYELPAWTSTPMVLKAIDYYKRNMSGPDMSCIVGPGVLLGFRAYSNVLILQIIGPVVAYLTTACKPGQLADHGADDDDNLWHVIKWTVPTFSFLFLIIGRAIWHQALLLRYTLLPQLHVTEKFNLALPCLTIRFNDYPFWVWFVFISVCSSFPVVEVWFNAEILGKVWRTSTCPDPFYRNTIEQKWKLTLAQSPYLQKILRWLPSVSQGESRMYLTVLAAYLFLLVQPVYLWCSCMPRYSSVAHPHYSVNRITKEEDKDGIHKRKVGFVYRTLLDNSSSHGQVVRIFASVLRFEGVTFQDIAYTKMKMEKLRKKGLKDYYYRALRNQMVRGIGRFGAVGLTQTVITVHIQLSLFALTYSGGSEELESPTGPFLSVMTGIVFGFVPDLVDMCDLFEFGWSSFKQPFDAENEDARTPISHSGRIATEFHTSKTWRDACVGARGKAMLSYIVFIICFAAYAFNFVWMFPKLYAALYHCRGEGYVGTWNWGTGCVMNTANTMQKP